MAAEFRGAGRRWAISVVGAVGVTAVGAFLFRLPAPPVRPPLSTPNEATRASVRVARPNASDRLLKQETELRDLRPLFLPTERNAALPDPRLEPGRTFLDSEKSLTFTDADVEVGNDLPPVVTLNGKRVEKASPVDVFGADAEGVSLLGFGRRPVAAAALQPASTRVGFIQVTSTRSGVRVLAEELPAEARPPVDKAWMPFELLAVVDAAGLASPLVVTEGSRVEEIDLHFRKFLTGTYRIGARLDPGIYQITVAP